MRQASTGVTIPTGTLIVRKLLISSLALQILAPTNYCSVSFMCKVNHYQINTINQTRVSLTQFLQNMRLTTTLNSGIFRE